jgi:hypothetical protein
MNTCQAPGSVYLSYRGSSVKCSSRPFAHVGFIFLLAVLVFVAAAGLAKLEQVAADYKMPSWLLWGMQFISIGLFIFDGILVLGASGILLIKVLVGLWKEKE